MLDEKSGIFERIELINSNWTDCAGGKGSIALRVGCRKSLETGLEVAIWEQQEGPACFQVRFVLCH
jgi:hypothetical protein